jgi:hypothetical protein
MATLVIWELIPAYKPIAEAIQKAASSLKTLEKVELAESLSGIGFGATVWDNESQTRLYPPEVDIYNRPIEAAR